MTSQYAALPFSLSAVGKVPFAGVPLHDPRTTHDEGPRVQKRRPKLVTSGILKGWNAAMANAFTAPPKPFEVWDLRWGDEENYWEANVVQETVTCPEDVERLLPAKWLSYRFDHGDVDTLLSRVCTMCTALVDRYVALSTVSPPTTPAEWRLRESLHKRILVITELLEAAIGENIPMVSLKDPDFLSSCWSRITEEDQTHLVATLRAGDGGDAVEEEVDD
jgi:hypothetical protein